MKKVLMISGSLPPIRCGVGDYAYKLVAQLADAGLDFDVLSTAGVDEKIPVPLRTVPNWKVTGLPRILRAIRQSGAEIIHIQYPAVGYRRQLGINLLPYALRLLRPRLRIIITLHEYHQSRWIGKLRNRITIWPAHEIIVSNQPDKNVLGKKSRIIPIGSNIDTAASDPAFYAKVLQSHQLDPAKPTLMFFGYPFPSKRLEILLDAFEEPQLQNHQLLLVGGGIDGNNAYQKMLRQKIAKLNHTVRRIGATGFMEGQDISKLMQEGRYFVLPNAGPLSAKSSTAITAVEHGMIVISRGAGTPDATAPFSHLKNCFLLNEVSARSIADTIDHLENSAEQRRQILSGLKALQKYFSWDHIVKEHIKLYEET
jgi:glycosyltransferase involved in cell wall biosynthesis